MGYEIEVLVNDCHLDVTPVNNSDSYYNPSKVNFAMILLYARKGPAQARVSMDIFHDGLRRETYSDTRITLAQYPIILVVHSVHFATFLRGIYAVE